MTWAFYTHNCPVISAELLFDETTLERTYYPEGCMWVAGNKIMANPGGAEIWYSADGGASWANTGSAPLSGSGYIASRIQYLASADAWFIQVYGPASNQCRNYRSTNNGASWTAMSHAGATGQIYEYSSQSMILDAEGRLVTSARNTANNDSYIIRWDTPATSTAATSVYRWTTGTRNTDNLKETTTGYLISEWTGSVQRLRWVPKTLDANYLYALELPWGAYDNAPFSEKCDDPTVWDSGATTWDSGATTWDSGESILFWDETIYTTPGAVTYFNHFYQGSSVPLAQISYDWGETMQWARVQTDGNAVVILAKPATPSNKLYAVRSESLSPLTFGAPVTIDLPYDPDQPTLQGQFYHKSGSTWIGYVVSSNYTKIFQFDL